MSTNVFWRPETPARGKRMDKGVKFALKKRFGDDLRGEGAVLTDRDVDYLAGVRDAQFKDDSETARDINELMDAINQYGAVRVWEAE